MDEDRIVDHRVLGPYELPRGIAFTYAGERLVGREGDTVATALWAAGIRGIGRAAGSVVAALYCGIGHCFACTLTVDGVQGVRGCLVPLRAGMRLEPDVATVGPDHAG